jgi:uncharacterized protein YggT (Ycf19 family)
VRPEYHRTFPGSITLCIRAQKDARGRFPLPCPLPPGPGCAGRRPPIPPALAQVLSGLLQLLWWAVIVRVVLSWVVRNPGNPVYRAVSAVTDPLLLPLRRFLVFGGIDLSPLVLLLLIRLAQSALASAAA